MSGKPKKKKKILLIVTLSLVLLFILGTGGLFLVGGKGLFIQKLAYVDVSDQMEAKQFTASNGVTLPYRVSLPEGYDSEKEYPLVFYLHGAGERGTDNYMHVKVNSVMQTLLNEENREAYPCIVLAPQCPEDRFWYPWLEGDTNFTVTEALVEFLEDAQESYSVDSRRIYITGVSMGAIGTWAMLARFPDTFAAAVPVCGAGDPAQAASYAQVPIWVFHGKRDTIVSVSYAHEMVIALKEAGSTVVKYTEYPWENHACWELAYREEELFPWMFAQIRP